MESIFEIRIFLSLLLSYAVFTEAAGIPSPSWPLSVELLESGEHLRKQNPRDDAPPQLLGGGPGRAQRGGGGGRQLLDRERGGRLQPDLPPAQGGHLCFNNTKVAQQSFGMGGFNTLCPSRGLLFDYEPLCRLSFESLLDICSFPADAGLQIILPPLFRMPRLLEP